MTAWEARSRLLRSKREQHIVTAKHNCSFMFRWCLLKGEIQLDVRDNPSGPIAVLPGPAAVSQEVEQI